MVPGAGIDSFVGNETGRTKRARRVRARDDIQDVLVSREAGRR